ncbi:hypothetical protein H5410_057664 [Solanum commersonii]|uniref:Uncharacterized protein n=1 Tax=Solanum commersonii TaxID=4109 RepID=A0A9J5WPL9_SOLCO|nr:hypothetical protein H5410_057664 [Solanum commersonii]
MTTILRGEVGVIPTIYLGMLLGGLNKSRDSWIGVLERLALINSVMDALPTYLMPLSLYLQKRGFHFVKCETLTISNHKGGFRVRNLRKQNSGGGLLGRNRHYGAGY